MKRSKEVETNMNHVDGDDNNDNFVENINNDYYSGQQQQQHCIFIRYNT